MKRTSRRRLLPMLLGGGLVLGLSMNAPAKAEELRIGFIAPLTGIFAQVGKDMRNGFQMYLDEHHNKLGGATVKFVVEDNQGKSDAAVTKAKKLVLSDKVHMFIGGLLASTGYALAPVSNEEKTLYIASIPAADDLTQRQLNKYPYFFRTGWTSSQPSHPMGKWACEQGYKKIATVAADYAFGGGYPPIADEKDLLFRDPHHRSPPERLRNVQRKNDESVMCLGNYAILRKKRSVSFVSCNQRSFVRTSFYSLAKY